MNRIELIIERAHRGEITAGERAELDAWRASSSAHEREYRELWRLLDATAALRTELKVAVPPDPAVVVPQAAAHGAAASHHDVAGERAGWRTILPWAIAAAAVLALAVVRVFPASAPVPAVAQAEVVTGAGEIATVQLGDGSVVRLAPGSRLRLAEDGDVRAVALDGHAFFVVAHRDGHAFRVLTPSGTATVLGTRFEIRTGVDELRLLVVEGRVALEAAANRVVVAAGESSAITRGQASAPVAVADVDTVLRWTGEFLAFQGTPLEHVARELMAKYDLNVTITDPELARRTVTAVFTGKDLRSVLHVVCEVVNARCTETPDGFVIAPG